MGSVHGAMDQCPAAEVCSGLGRPCSVGRLGAARRRVIELARGQRTQGAPGGSEAVRTVHSGLLALCAALPDGRRQIISLAGPGEPMYCCPVPGLACWVEALSRTVVCEVPLPRTSVLAERPGEAVFALLQMTRRQLEGALAHVVNLGRLDGSERLAAFLVDMARRLGRREGDHWSVALAMTREDIADHLGLNSDTITRILGRLKRKGLVLPRSNCEFLISDLDALEAGLPPGIPATGTLPRRRAGMSAEY